MRLASRGLVRPGIGGLNKAIAEVGKLLLTAGHKQTLYGQEGHTNFPLTIPLSSLFVMLLKLANLWKFNQTNS